MSIFDYIKDKAGFIFINLIVFSVIGTVLYLSNVPSIVMLCIFIVWFLPITVFMILDYIKYNSYLKSIHNSLNSLDQKHLLPELMKESNFYIGNEMNNILKIISRDMHENINKYKYIQEDYKEYIEMWVHEIKTPIASSKLVIENNKNEITDKIDRELDKIDNFIEQVLYYSRSEEVNKDYVIKEVMISEIVNAVVKRNYREFINRKISLKLDVKDINILCDKKWVEFILNQIIINSLKYSKMKDGEIKIYIEERNDTVALFIEDNGIGICDRDLDRVFEKGFTGENGRKFGKSTGIGLYICKKLCERLGIGIKLQSEFEKGTKVILYFHNKRII